MPRLYIMSIVRTLHTIFTVVWFGGMVTLALAVLPTLWDAEGLGKRQIELAAAIQRRLRTSALVSMVGLAITGALLGRTGPAMGTLFHFGSPYQTVLSIKHLFTIAMVLVSVARQWITRPANVSARTKTWSRVMLWCNLALGVAVLYLSSVNTTMRLVSGG